MMSMANENLPVGQNTAAAKTYLALRTAELNTEEKTLQHEIVSMC